LTGLEKNPIFGGKGKAQDASDQLNDLGKLNLIVSSFMTPDNKDSIIYNNATRLTFSALALGATSGITGTIKSSGRRSRPDKTDRNTFPSDHTSQYSTQAALSSSNIQQMSQLTNQKKQYWQVSTSTVSVPTA